MPLDPYVQGFLQKLAASNQPKIWQLSPADARQVYVGLAHVTDAKDVPIGNVEDSEEERDDAQDERAKDRADRAAGSAQQRSAADDDRHFAFE